MVKSLVVGTKHDKLRNNFQKTYFSFLLLAPAIIYALIYCYATLPYLYLAFVKFNYRDGLFNSTFVGLKNFEFFFKSQSLFTVTGNTLKFNLLDIVVGTILSLSLAILFNEVRSKVYVKVSQTILLFPYFISWVAVHYFVYNLLASGNNGLINKLLIMFGAKPINFYSKPGYWTFIVTCLMIWKSAGMNNVIYMAAITGIDQEMYEAATIDGSNRWQNIWYITLPSLAPTICILTLLSLGKVFYGNFGMMYALIGDNGVLFPTTDIIDTYVYRALRKSGDPSSATAVSLVQSLLGFILVLITNSIVKRINPESSII